MMLIVLLVLGLSASVEPNANYGCYGDLRSIDTPVITCGNVADTSNCGGTAIERVAQIDIVRVRRYEVQIRNVARNLCVEPALIAAMICRESRVGHLLVNGWNSGRSRYGLMQIHSHYYPIIGAWNSEEHISQATTILITQIRALRKRFPHWTWQQYWRGGICAYQAGITDILSYPGTDFCGTYRRFADEVIFTARYYSNSLFLE
ncbi:lysozyme g-like [Hemicordylus capensis]|uniref:lysozyme g-like n=1 Tax=Hemicordylus capensis TaxID=884348 RepID=UPI0023032500|nr:lysozyme g-like [Hemicordylus capensis]